LLVKHFPHKRDREVAQITYIRNICEMSDYCPELNGRIWDQVIDRLLRIDVEITRAVEMEEDDDDEEDEDERLAELCAASELRGDPWDISVLSDVPPDPRIRDRHEEADDDDDGDIDLDNLSDEGEGGSDDGGPADIGKEGIIRARKKLHLILMRRKLDGMLVYFYRHLEESMGYRSASPPAFEFAASTLTAASSGRSTPATETPLPTPPIQPTTRRPRASPAQSLAFFQTLLNLFSRQILPTSATQHIPFLLFLCSSFSPAHTDLFLGLLVSHSLYGASAAPSAGSLVQPISLNQRVAATVYIGSAVCRARFVNDDKARQVMTYLLAYMEGKLQQSKRTSKVDELPLFYAVCQAAMLIFCFRWRAFLPGDRDDEVVGEMEMEGEDGETGDEGKWMAELEVLQRALTSELNPLLVSYQTAPRWPGNIDGPGL
jgi:RNA polymerase I-specific transcription initiation factor RRN3